MVKGQCEYGKGYANVWSQRGNELDEVAYLLGREPAGVQDPQEQGHSAGDERETSSATPHYSP